MIDFNSKKSGKWFYTDEQNPDSGGVCINFHLRTHNFHVAYNDILIYDNIFRIIGWKNISIDGVEVLYSFDNLTKLLKDSHFSIWVLDCIDNFMNKSV